MSANKTDKLVAALVEALVETLNASIRPPALYSIARLKYPPRGVFVNEHPDGSIVVMLAKYGYEYKHRGPKPKSPPAVNVAAIRDALNTALSSAGVTVTAVVDSGTYIEIFLEESV